MCHFGPVHQCCQRIFIVLCTRPTTSSDPSPRLLKVILVAHDNDRNDGSTNYHLKGPISSNLRPLRASLINMPCTKACHTDLGTQTQVGENPSAAHPFHSHLIDKPLFPPSHPSPPHPHGNDPVIISQLSLDSPAYFSAAAHHSPRQISDAGDTPAYYANEVPSTG